MWIEAPIELNKLPREPGIYRMLDARRKVLYIGKARNLRKRVSSYFQRQPDNPRTRSMVLHIRDIETTTTTSEAEALILEHNLIKQLKPRYNVLLKDSKSYPYLLLTDEPFPRLMLYRGDRSRPGEYFGPFPNAGAVHETLHTIQKVFRIRDCTDATFNSRSRPCMQHQIGRCSAPCCARVGREAYHAQVAEVRTFLKGKDANLLRRWEDEMQLAAEAMRFEDAATLRDRIRALRLILSGSEERGLPQNADAVVVIRHATAVSACIGVRRAGRTLGVHCVKADQAIEAEDLEILQSLFIERYSRETPPSDILLAAAEHDISELKHLLKVLHPKSRTQLRAPKRGILAGWMNEVRRSGEQSLASRANRDQQAAFEALAELLHLDETPQRIAAVDNAHLGGKQTVAAIVCADWNGPDKAHYRRYRLDDVPAGDDYAAMDAVLSRFFRAINEEAIPCPDLMLIDGGKGQLSVAMEAAAGAGLSELKMIAVAKGKSRKPGEELLIPSWQDERLPASGLKPGKHSAALLLVARVRDEAHRFAGEYMRKRKKKSMFTSTLDNVPGIGSARRTAILKHFGGIEGVKKASRKQLAEVPGVSEKLAAKIFTSLHK